MENSIQGVIIGVTRQGFLIGKSFNIFVTRESLVFSLITSGDRKASNKKLDEKVKGKSFKERLEIIAHHTYELPTRYDSMSIHEILSEHSSNFEIPFQQISKIKIKRPKTRNTEGYKNQDYFVILTHTHKHTIKPLTAEAITLFSNYLGDKFDKQNIVL